MALLDDLLREPCLLQIFRKEDIEFFEYVFTAKGYNIRNYVAHAFIYTARLRNDRGNACVFVHIALDDV